MKKKVKTNTTIRAALKTKMKPIKSGKLKIVYSKRSALKRRCGVKILYTAMISSHVIKHMIVKEVGRFDETRNLSRMTLLGRLDETDLHTTHKMS